MQSNKRTWRAPTLMLWGTLLSALTGLLGAAPFRVLRNTMGSPIYWLSTVALVSGAILLNWPMLALVLALQMMLMGVYSEFESREYSVAQAGFFAVIVTAFAGYSAFFAWTVITGKGWLNQLNTAVAPLLDRAKAMNVQVLSEIKTQDIVAQLPSFFLVFLILSLAIALMAEKRFSYWVGAKAVRQERLSDFCAPDFLIWALILSLLGTFGDFGSKVVAGLSLNILNVLAAVYFFQGLAVLGKYFEAFRVSLFWRLLWIALVVVQLPILMSLLGVVDYWADFRKAFVKKATEMRKKSVQD